MADHSEAFVGIDTSKLRNAVAVAESGRKGEIRFLGEIDNTPEATRKLVAKLAGRYRKLHFCYEAGPTGYGLYRTIADLGQSCIVVAPSLIPTRPGDQIKTNRRDAEGLARAHRAGDLTAVWVPDAQHEAIRDLVRAREAAVRDYRVKRQQVTSFLLRHGRHFPGLKAWSKAHARWLAQQKFDNHAHYLVLQEALGGVRDASERLTRLEAGIRELAAGWTLGPVVDAVQAMRGFEFVAAATIVAEIGDFSRFESPRQLMAYVGLVPSEHSTGDSVRRGSITKTGNSAARRMLVECAWHYRHPARIGVAKQRKAARLPNPSSTLLGKRKRGCSACSKAR